MARRGRCRCGLILTFRRTARGYKTCCPGCGAVVRLRVKGKRRRRPRPDTSVLPTPGEIDVELVPLSELGATPSPTGRGKRWLIVAAGGIVVLAAAGGAFWFLR